MPKKSELGAVERAQLVLRLLSKEEPAVQIARRPGMSEQTLYRWWDEFISGGRRSSPAVVLRLCSSANLSG